MVDSGATSTVMPKKITDLLNLKYEPLEKGVVKLDRTLLKTLRVIKNVSLTLHSCPNFSIPRDIYVIDLPAYFAICLSRDFTAKIDGYFSSHWSHLYFKTRYGTKVTIKSESLVKNHIEPYNPSPINSSCVIMDQDETPDYSAYNTQTEAYPDIFLDEWATRNE